MEAMSSVILCGGRSRRMGRDKAALPWNGRELLDGIAGELSPWGDVFLSADGADRFGGKPYPVVGDHWRDCGPLGGICSALLACGTPLLFVVSCDMPFVTGEVGGMLRERMEDGWAAAVPREPSGRVHPLCAVYRKSAMPLLYRQIQTGNYRMQDALRCLETLYVPAEELPGGSRVLRNVNTPEDYRALLSESAARDAGK